MIQSLAKTVGIDRDRLIVLDSKKRNAADYTGDVVEDAAVNECTTQATELLALVKSWLEERNS